MLKKTIFANYVGAGAMVLAPILALPWYLSLLGPKQFGLVSFVTALQTFLGLLDSGICQISLREFSVRTSGTRDGRKSAGLLLFGFERVYWLGGIVAAAVTILLSPVIAKRWLVLDPDSTFLGFEAVCGGAAIFAAQFPGSLYRSFLIGSHHQVELSIISVVCLTLRHGGAVALLFVRPELSTYLVWQALSLLLETAARRRVTWRALAIPRGELGWDTALLKPLGVDIAKMAGAVFLGALTTQMDKIIISRMLPIEQFGYYAIATTVALGILNLITPLVQALLPRILKANDDPMSLRALNVTLAKYIGLLVLAGGVGYMVLGKWVLQIWLRKPDIVAIVHPLISVLLVGSALNAFYHVGYFTWLGKGKTGRIVTVNALSLAVCVLVIPPMVHWWGMIGATFGFVAMNLFGLLVSLEWLHPIKPPERAEGAVL